MKTLVYVLAISLLVTQLAYAGAKGTKDCHRDLDQYWQDVADRAAG